LADKNLALLRCASGFTKNQLEFVHHSLGQSTGSLTGFILAWIQAGCYSQRLNRGAIS
jgi:hypothetical protein